MVSRAPGIELVDPVPGLRHDSAMQDVSIITLNGHTPRIDPSAYIAPGCRIIGDVIGGLDGFIGRRMIPLLVQRGQQVVCVDISTATNAFDALGDKVRMLN